MYCIVTLCFRERRSLVWRWCASTYCYQTEAWQHSCHGMNQCVAVSSPRDTFTYAILFFSYYSTLVSHLTNTTVEYCIVKRITLQYSALPYLSMSFYFKFIDVLYKFSLLRFHFMITSRLWRFRILQTPTQNALPEINHRSIWLVTPLSCHNKTRWPR